MLVPPLDDDGAAYGAGGFGGATGLAFDDEAPASESRTSRPADDERSELSRDRARTVADCTPADEEFDDVPAV